MQRAVFAEDQATISAKVPGRVARAGDRELERGDYEFRVRQAEAALRQTQARLGLKPAGGGTVEPAETSLVKLAEAVRAVAE